jgi:hypothetical protein
MMSTVMRGIAALALVLGGIGGAVAAAGSDTQSHSRAVVADDSGWGGWSCNVPGAPSIKCNAPA